MAVYSEDITMLPDDIVALATETKTLFDAASPLSTAGRSAVRSLTEKIQHLVMSIDARVLTVDLKIATPISSSSSQLGADVLSHLENMQTQVSLVIGRGAAGRALLNVQQVVT